MSNENKRDFTRAAVGVEAEIVAGDTMIRGQIGDVSLKGLLLACADTLPEGSECHVRILLGDSAAPLLIEAKGKVVRNLDEGIAVEFTGVDLDSYGHLKNLVSMNVADIEQAESEFRSHVGLKKMQSL